MAKDTDLRGLFPGLPLEFELADGKKLRVVVYSLAVGQIRKFSQEILSVIRNVLPTIKITVDDSKPQDEQVKQMILQVLTKIAPLMISDLCELIGSCLRFEAQDAAGAEYKPVEGSLDDLPHEIGVALAAAWLKESFSDPKKWTPWKAMFQDLKGMLPKTDTTSAT